MNELWQDWFEAQGYLGDKTWSADIARPYKYNCLYKIILLPDGQSSPNGYTVGRVVDANAFELVLEVKGVHGERSLVILGRGAIKTAIEVPK